MNYSSFGKSNYLVSKVGFGTWGVGGHGYGAVDDNTSIATIKMALDYGINFFDTADVYGFGHSEKILAKSLGHLRHEVIIATKFGVGWDSNSNTFKDISADYMVKALDASLRRLNIDRIPIFQIHWIDGKTPIDEILTALDKCKINGKIDHIGICNVDSNFIDKCQSLVRIESFQTNYNFLDNFNEAIFNSSSFHQMGVVGYGLLGRGLLTGKYSSSIKFNKGDTRSEMKKNDTKNFNRFIDASNLLNEFSKSFDITPAQLAIKLALLNKNLTCGLVGILNQEQLTEIVDLFNKSISNHDLLFIKNSILNSIEKNM